jgi:sugar lactone lactonase YvrE/enterochelin esterase-like enzyme
MGPPLHPMILRRSAWALGFVALTALLAPVGGADPAAVVPGLRPDTTNDGQPVQLPKVGPDAQGNYPPPAEAAWPAGVPRGDFVRFTLSDSRIFPGTDNPITIYVPSAYTGAEPACLYLKLDAITSEPQIFEHLIARHQMPLTIIVGIAPGAIWNDPAAHQVYRYNRSYEFDSTNAHFADFLEQELLPAVQRQVTRAGHPIRLSANPGDRAIAGGSTGGIASFTVAWQRPDLVSRVFSTCGTFVAMRGGDEYPTLVRKTEPKPIRIFLEDGSHDAWNPLFGSWYLANLNLDAALRFAGYDEAHLWGEHGHDGRLSAAVLPEVMRWLWRDWPAPVRAGVSHNDMLSSILAPGEGWQTVARGYHAADGLAANASGMVVVADAGERAVDRIDGAKPTPLFRGLPPIHGEAFGADGTLYATAPGEQRLLALDPTGRVRTVGDGLRADRIIATADGALLVTEPGDHPELPGRIWRFKPSGEKSLLDAGLPGVSGVAVSPDHGLLVATEPGGKWIDSFVLRTDGSAVDRQRYFWLHLSDVASGSEARDLCYDTQGNLWVATSLGIQVCDRNGRVRGILPLPSPSGPVLSLCFGGPGFHTLYATDGHTVFRRTFAVTGSPAWAPVVALPPASQG